jgi:electron transfer flavoprotein alpha subunit
LAIGRPHSVYLFSANPVRRSEGPRRDDTGASGCDVIREARQSRSRPSGKASIMLNIVVLVKVVPDVSQLLFDRELRALVREGVRNVINPFDRRALEEALRLREASGGTVRALSMGPPSVEAVLHEPLAMGVDEVYLLTDKAFAGSDTLATSRALSLATKELGFDLVLGGAASVDAETSQVMPEVAQMLGVSLATNARKVELLDGHFLRVERDYEDGVEALEIGLPAVVSVGEKINKPRAPSEQDRLRAAERHVETWQAGDLPGDASGFGTSGSPTWVKSIFDASVDRHPVVFDGTVDPVGAVQKCIAQLTVLIGQAPQEAADMSRATDPRPAWVVLSEGRQEVETALELLGKVRALGLRPVGVFLPGAFSKELAGRCAKAGAAEVVELASVGAAQASSLACATALAEGIQKERPFAVLFPSTVRCREAAGRLAGKLRLGLTGDATDLKLHRSGELIQVKPAFGGSVMAEVISKTLPRMATVRPGVFQREDLPVGEVPIRTLAVSPDVTESLKMVSRTVTVDPRAGDLDRAKVVVCGGFGLGSKEGFAELASFASRIGAALAATRKVVDLGWAPAQSQVGLTGKSIHPDLLIEVGVSGSVNHTIGTRRAKLVLSVNRDSQSLSMKACDVGLVADFESALKPLEEGVRPLAAALNTERRPV